MRIGTYLGHIRLTFGTALCGQHSYWLVNEERVWKLRITNVISSRLRAE